MNPLLERILEEGATATVGAVAGWVLSAAKVGRKFDAFRKKIDEVEKTRDEFSLARGDEYETKLAARFEQLRAFLVQGLQLEVRPLRERVEDVARQVESLRSKSGEWSSEAELAQFVTQTQQELARINRDIGKLEGRMRRTSDRPGTTVRPPPGWRPPK